MRGIFIAGSDPELMLLDPKGELVSAIGRVPGTKKRPYKVPGGAIQRDNVLLELNTNPAETSEEFISNLREVLVSAAKIAAPCNLTVRASAQYPEKQLRRREARVFGCDPDYNAWTLDRNMVPAEAQYQPFRSAGGHLHIGKTPEIADMLDDDYGKIAVVKMLDVFVGIPSLILDEDATSAARRSLYGKAGAHRPKPYGVEYRALGNFWVWSPKLVETVYQLADIAVRLTLAGESDKIFAQVGGETVVQDIINNSRHNEAGKLLNGVLAEYLPSRLVQSIVTKEASQDIWGKDLYQIWGI